MSTQQEKERLCEILLAGGEWFQMPKRLFQMMPMDEAVVLSLLMNVSNTVQAHLRDGWFQFSIDKMEEELSISERIQRRVIRNLQEAERVESEQRGMPAKRHFRINYLEITKDIFDTKNPSIPTKPLVHDPTAASGQDRTAASGHTVYKKELNKEQESELPSVSSDTMSKNSSLEDNEDDQISKSGFPLSENNNTSSPSNFDLKCAKELNKAVVKNFKNDRKNSIRKWSIDFRKLRIKDGASKDLIKKVLKWYVLSDWSDEYLPQAYCGKSFRDKFFDKLIPAMKRDENYKQEETDYDQEEPVKEKPKSKPKLTREERIVEKDEWDRVELGYSKVEYDEYKTNYEIEYGEKYVNPLIH